MSFSLRICLFLFPHNIIQPNMDQLDEAKESLLIYLQANRNFIDEKIYNQFNVECIQGKTLQTLDVEKMGKTIKDIFDFGSNAVYAYFFSRLQSNIKEYIKQQYSTKAIPSFFVLDIDKLIDVVKYCIDHGFDQSAKKAMKEQKKVVSKETPKEPAQPPPKATPIQLPKAQVQPIIEKPKEKPRVVFVQQVKKVQPPKDEFAHVKSKLSTFLERDKIPEKKEFKIQKYSMPELNVLPRYLASLPKSPIKEEQEQERIVVEALDDGYLNAHRKILRERLEKLFNFYCYQQQSLGQGPTFDRMKNQGQSMNLGKFMQFCQYTRLFQCKEISKEMLMTEFKCTSQGKLQILFQTFENIIMKLDEKYLQVMKHDPINNPIPTYEARLMLNEPGKLGQLKKQRNLVFGTRSKEGRQVKQWSQSTRYVKKELTGHSGRFVKDLSFDAKQRPQPPKTQRKVRAIKASQVTIKLNDLKKLKLPKISWIQQQQDEFRVRAHKKF